MSKKNIVLVVFAVASLVLSSSRIMAGGPGGEGLACPAGANSSGDSFQGTIVLNGGGLSGDSDLLVSVTNNAGSPLERDGSQGSCSLDLSARPMLAGTGIPSSPESYDNDVTQYLGGLEAKDLTGLCLTSDRFSASCGFGYGGATVKVQSANRKETGSGNVTFDIVATPIEYEQAL